MSFNILIVGAGEAGQELALELSRIPNGPRIAGFIDDDLSKTNRLIHSIPVLGTVAELDRLIHDHQVQEVVVSAPSAAGELVRRVIAACRQSKVRFRIVPRLVEIIEGHVHWEQVTEVQPEDLLGRTVVRHDLERARRNLEGKTVLLTGAAGSIGSDLTRQLVRLGATKLVLVDCNENGMFFLREELRSIGSPTEVIYQLANLRDRARLQRIFEIYRPSVVFHAAAYKHVPLMEDHPSEAVLNNIEGTRNVAEEALRGGCEDFVMVSTDKAVNPTNVMGATKRASEKLIQVLADRKKTRFVSVRFGNVLGSAGSVIPIFKKQIDQGGPVTVTHPDMIRFFMTIPEAAQLIIQAWALGENGQVFVLDMGEPVKILDLAEQMIRLHGFEPGREIPIQFTGLRPGEKLFEELLTDREKVLSTRHDKIFVAREEEVFDRSAYEKEIDQVIAVAHDGAEDQVLHHLRALVPTYRPSAKAPS